MSQQLSLQCRCGKLRGVAADVSAQSVTRVVCYCRDCRAFAHFLERPDVLDAGGGSDVVQIAHSHVRLTSGLEVLACVRLTETGMFRWYASCCRTPVANTLRAGVPFAGVMRDFIDVPSAAADGLLGTPIPVRTKFAIGTPPLTAAPFSELGLIARVAKHLLTWKLTGRAFPSAFFVEETRAPRVAPQVLSHDQREALRTADRTHSLQTSA